MVVTALREHPRRAGRYRADLGGVVAEPVSVEMIAALGLRVGLAVDAATFARLQHECAAVACFDRATDALARRSRSRADLALWLRQRGFAAAAIERALERLAGLGLVDDLAFAQGFARTRLVGRGYGPRRVAAELARRGVARDVVDRVLADAAAEREGDGHAPGIAASAVETAAAKRAPSLRTLEPEVAERRLMGWLVRRGYGPGEARKAAREALAAG